jgi:DNA-binding SARP family transcriptional activator
MGTIVLSSLVPEVSDGELGLGVPSWDSGSPVRVHLLGTLQLFKRGQLVPLRSGGKTEALLAHLGLAGVPGVARARLLSSIWPHSDPGQAGQALNSVVHTVRAMLGDALGGASPVLHAAGQYGLNTPAGVAVDVAHFGALVDQGDQLQRRGQADAARAAYVRAVSLYGGDLSASAGADARAVLDRERLRATFCRLLVRLADDAFARRDLNASLAYATELLACDPCREDGHRLVMRCHVRLGARSQALSHYRAVQAILYTESHIEPEPATTALFEQIRLDPGAV